ncbi:MAG: carbohydrate kinase, partial [Erysipelotrichaceae bacterium]|nr:carbohydrate kinase [Erysipelotrichaceae bacterium]
MNYLGFDIGTSACKTTVMDENEQILYESTVEYTYDEPQSGYREIEPGTWTEAIDQELANVFGSSDPDTFAVIGVTGQM